jgi:hypothetical protein
MFKKLLPTPHTWRSQKALVRSSAAARPMARMYGTPIYVWENGASRLFRRDSFKALSRGGQANKRAGSLQGRLDPGCDPAIFIPAPMRSLSRHSYEMNWEFKIPTALLRPPQPFVSRRPSRQQTAGSARPSPT